MRIHCLAPFCRSIDISGVAPSSGGSGQRGAGRRRDNDQGMSNQLPPPTTHRRTDGQTDDKMQTKTHTHTYTLAHKRRERQTRRQIYRQTIHTDTDSCRQADGRTD